MDERAPVVKREGRVLQTPAAAADGHLPAKIATELRRFADDSLKRPRYDSQP